MSFMILAIIFPIMREAGGSESKDNNDRKVIQLMHNNGIQNGCVVNSVNLMDWIGTN